MSDLNEVLSLLNAATDKGTITWEETTLEDVFRARLGKGTVQLAWRPVAPHYEIELFDPESRLLDTFRPSGEGSNLAIEALYKKVRRSVLDLDAKARDLVNELKSRAGVA